MNKSALKKYAPQARLDFITAVTRRAELLGLNPKSPAKIEKQGEALLINGKAFPAAYAQMRNTLEARIREQGFAQVMEAMAYTWFNRLVAIRYMELHGFLDHGYRVLSHPNNAQTGHTQPEILDHIAELELPGLEKSAALELKLAGNKDEELYREVLLAQCHALHTAMPFLFESLDDATELLLPDGLLRTDSLLAPLVTKIDDADWQEVEIIGWLYQFYISEKKDQVIGKVVKSEDIPAATQLFTPNWIVKYLVQNSLGRLWLMANPTSQLAAKWEYYIKPAEQTEEVNAQLDALIQARIDEDGATLNPESLTLLDPACGSGHILVEAYDLLRDIYLERGYRRQDIPRLILEKNLYGLDIDDRAAQLAGFALLMKARTDDRRLFGQAVALNVLALQEAKAGSAEELHSALNAPQIDYVVVSQLVETFEQAKTFGSLIQVSDELASALPELRRDLGAVRDGGDMLGRDAAETLLRLVAQAEVLAKAFDAVVANPPYMGGKGMNADLKAWAKNTFPASKSDLFAMFIERGFGWCKPAGFNSMVTMQSWMFLSGFEEMRKRLLSVHSLFSLIHLPYDGKGPTAMGLSFGVNAAVMNRLHIDGLAASFDCFRHFELESSGLPKHFPSKNERNLIGTPDEFRKIPGSPVAYWVRAPVFEAFSKFPSLSTRWFSDGPCKSGNDDLYLRQHWEVNCQDVGQNDSWRLCSKGGEFRQFFGNVDHVLKWRPVDQDHYRRDRIARITPKETRDLQGITWPIVSSKSERGFRLLRAKELFNSVSPAVFPKSNKQSNDQLVLLCYLNSTVAQYLLRVMNPTLALNVSNVLSLPFPESLDMKLNYQRLIDIHSIDWNWLERSESFEVNPVVAYASENITLVQDSFHAWNNLGRQLSEEVRSLMEEVNRFFIALFAMENEVVSSVSLDNVSLESNLYFKYPNRGEAEGFRLFKRDAISCVISYAIGCMMGRYSLDAPGLIYAHFGNEGFDPIRYTTFPADDDGIVPITDEAWFDDDGANRIREFVRVVWGEESEAENMAWLAESLGQKASESADDTIRRYLSRDFYKDHLQTYKKRPIYWLFSSGKHKAFEALVYLHRYNAGTLSRMRMEYVVPLQSRMQARIDNLDQDIQSSTSSAEQKRFQKQKDKLIKQLDELRRFDENLRHYADQRITLDLDDGVKVNYGKFGDLLAEVKAVTGNK